VTRDTLSSAEQQEQQCDLLSARTGIEEASSSFPSKSSVMASKSLRSMALSLRLRPRSLSKIRIAASVDHENDNTDRKQAIFVADQTFRRTTVQFVLRQRAAAGSA
jgi:hypothetical protein